MLFSQRSISRFIVLGCLVLGPAASSAQSAAVAPGNGPGSPSLGFELELHGSEHAYAGRPLRLRGVAYEVLDLATLHPLGAARVSFAFDSVRETQSPVGRDVTAGADGQFEAEITMPEN